jgi:hypothetical protein
MSVYLLLRSLESITDRSIRKVSLLLDEIKNSDLPRSNIIPAMALSAWVNPSFWSGIAALYHGKRRYKATK